MSKKTYQTIHFEGVTFSLGNTKLGDCVSVSINNTFCNPEWPCYAVCYARRLANFRASVKTSYDNNTAVLLEDRDRYFKAVDKALNYAEMFGMPFRFHVDGEIPDYDYFDRACKVIAKHDVPIIFMTKRHDIVNAWIDANGFDALPFLPRLSTWPDMEVNNPYGLPESGFIPKGEEIGNRKVCPNQLAKASGKEWVCNDCVKHCCGCLSKENINFCEH